MGMNESNLLASLGVCKLLMIAYQVLLIPRILLHPLVVFKTLENHLTETVKVGNIAHLRVIEL